MFNIKLYLYHKREGSVDSDRLQITTCHQKIVYKVETSSDGIFAQLRFDQGIITPFFPPEIKNVY